METRYSTCLFCDGGCTAESRGEGIRILTLHRSIHFTRDLCSKAG